MSAALTADEYDGLCEASLNGGARAWRAEIDRILDTRLASVTAERDRLAEVVEAVRGLATDLWRVAPCGCGHRADLHKLDEGICLGGLTLCKCRHSFTSIIRERLTALLPEATS